MFILIAFLVLKKAQINKRYIVDQQACLYMDSCFVFVQQTICEIQVSINDAVEMKLVSKLKWLCTL